MFLPPLENSSQKAINTIVCNGLFQLEVPCQIFYKFSQSGSSMVRLGALKQLQK